MSDRFDFDEVFDEDYLHFYGPWMTTERTAAEVALITGLLGLRPGERVLDLACGHGRMANRLAAAGCRLTGLDRSKLFLDVARRDAAELGVEVDYREGDVRELDSRGGFDAVLHWFTSFGYFDDDTNREILHRIHEALVPGGRLLLETINLYHEVFDPSSRAVKRVGRDFMIDERRYDVLTGRQAFERTVLRQGRPPRTMRFFVRLFALTELRDWLLQAGFVDVSGYGGDGEPFELDSERLILVARRPESP